MNRVAMPKFGPEPGFRLRTPEPNLRFRSSPVPVLLADRMFSSRFQEANDFVNPVWTSNHGWFNEHIYYEDWQLSIIISEHSLVCYILRPNCCVMSGHSPQHSIPFYVSNLNIRRLQRWILCLNHMVSTGIIINKQFNSFQLVLIIFFMYDPP